MTHTPGPWRAVKQNVESYFVVYAGKVQVADLYGLTGEQDEDGQDEFISDDESAANAQLIALAPEMLSMLEASENALRSYQYGNGSAYLAQEVASRIEALIAKAKS
jgi:hypothetical protein